MYGWNVNFRKRSRSRSSIGTRTRLTSCSLCVCLFVNSADGERRRSSSEVIVLGVGWSDGVMGGSTVTNNGLAGKRSHCMLAQIHFERLKKTVPITNKQKRLLFT